MAINRIKISRKKLLFVLMIFFAYYPENLSKNVFTAYLGYFGLLISFIYCIQKYFYDFLKRKMDGFKLISFLIIFKALYMFWPTLLNGQSILGNIKFLIAIIIIVLMTHGETKNNKEQYLGAIKMLLVLYICLQIFFEIVGFGFSVFTDINRIYLVTPLVGFIMFAQNVQGFPNSKHNRLWFFLLAIIVFVTTVILNLGFEASFFLSSIVLIIPCAIKENKLLNINPLMILLGISILWILLVLSEDQFDIPFLSFLITKVLGKKSNITGRTALWEASIDLIKSNYITGYGSAWNGLNIWYGHYQPHNQLLYEFIVGGVINFAISILLIIFVYFATSKKIGGIFQVSKYAFTSVLLLEIATNFPDNLNIPYYFLILLIMEECSNNIKANKLKNYQKQNAS